MFESESLERNRVGLTKSYFFVLDLAMVSIHPTLMAVSKDVPGGLQSNPEAPHPVKSTRSAHHHVAWLLDYPLYLVPVVDKPVDLLVPQALVLVEVQLKL